ncbi:hypothetical protein MBLNU459_g3783t1 [Dothideomycetes sp. NU459]
MASHDNEKVTFGATIDPSVKQTNHLLTPNVFDTPKTLTPVVTQEDRSNKTPFYSHSSAAASQLSMPSPSLKSPVAVYETDLEAGRATNSQLNLSGIRTNASGYRSSLDARPKECTMWPTKETLREKAKQEKCRKMSTRGFGCGRVNVAWAHLDKKQRLWYKIALALFLVAIAVALGVGITKAVGGGVWASNGQQKTIPSS